MPYSYPNNIPRVAKNWSEAEQKRCVAASNAVLNKKGTEQDAIFACIHAAGKGKNKMSEEKASVTKVINGVKYPAGCFLVVEDPQKPDTWHLPVKTPDGKPDMRHMAAAAAALTSNFRGKGYQGPQKAQALAKLKKMYAQMGKPFPGQKTVATFFKDKKNGLWFIGVYSNNFVDRQKEIISEAAHEEYAAWIKNKGIKPPIVLLHLPKMPEAMHFVMLLGVATGKITAEKYNAMLGDLYRSTAIGQTEKVFVKGGFAFVVGKVFDNKRKMVEKLMPFQKKWGMSHGFIPLHVDDKINVIDQYRSFEFTLAPESFLANDFTAIGFKEETMEENKKSLSSTEIEIIDQVLDEANADEAIEKIRNELRELLASKMDNELEETPDTEVDVEEETETQKPADEYTELATKLMADFKLEELAEVIKTIGARLTALETGQTEVKAKLTEAVKTEDERVVDQYFKGVDWSLGMAKKLDSEPTEDEKNLIEKLKSDIPEQVVEGETKVDPTNALQVGLWAPLLRS